MAYYAWGRDNRVNMFENPWPPIVELIRSGIPFDYGETDGESVVMNFYVNGGNVTC